MNELMNVQTNKWIGVIAVKKFMLIESSPWKFCKILHKSVYMAAEIFNAQGAQTTGILICQNGQGKYAM